MKSANAAADGNVQPGGHTLGKKVPGASPNLEGFNETAYILGSPKDSDTYKLNAFNQAESDKIASDRSIPDTRNYRWVWQYKWRPKA